MDKIRYLGGAHISDYGLHLGHLYGSIMPLLKNEINNNIYFLVGDVSKTNAPSSYDLSIYTICSQIYAINQIHNLNIKIIRQSTLRKYFSQFYFDITEHITKIQYKNVLTPRQQQENISISELLYPIETTIALMLLKIDCVLLTGNDHELISFSRKTIKKFSVQNPSFRCSPRIYYKKDDFIRGWNYKKMGVINNNCIYISDKDSILERKIKKLFSVSEYQKHIGVPKISLNQKSIDYLPIQYMYQFSSKEITKENLLTKTKNCLMKDLLKTIESLILPINESALKFDYNEIICRLKKDEILIVNTIKNSFSDVDINSYQYR